MPAAPAVIAVVPAANAPVRLMSDAEFKQLTQDLRAGLPISRTVNAKQFIEYGKAKSKELASEMDAIKRNIDHCLQQKNRILGKIAHEQTAPLTGHRPDTLAGRVAAMQRRVQSAPPVASSVTTSIVLAAPPKSVSTAAPNVSSTVSPTAPLALPVPKPTPAPVALAPKSSSMTFARMSPIIAPKSAPIYATQRAAPSTLRAPNRDPNARTSPAYNFTVQQQLQALTDIYGAKSSNWSGITPVSDAYCDIDMSTFSMNTSPETAPLRHLQLPSSVMQQLPPQQPPQSPPQQLNKLRYLSDIVVPPSLEHSSPLSNASTVSPKSNVTQIDVEAAEDLFVLAKTYWTCLPEDIAAESNKLCKNYVVTICDSEDEQVANAPITVPQAVKISPQSSVSYNDFEDAAMSDSNAVAMNVTDNDSGSDFAPTVTAAKQLQKKRPLKSVVLEKQRKRNRAREATMTEEKRREANRRAAMRYRRNVKRVREEEDSKLAQILQEVEEVGRTRGKRVNYSQMILE